MTRTLKDIQQHTLVRIVDDNEDLRETCEMMLTYAGWQVRTYAGAWSFLMDDAPSVPGCLILDISMPDMTGTELQMEMRRRRYSLPIIILTGHANVDLAVTTLKAGAAEFFEKPVDEDRLMKAIAKLPMRRRSSVPQLKRLLRPLKRQQSSIAGVTRLGEPTHGKACLQPMRRSPS